MISTTRESATYRNVPRVLVNYFKLLCQVNCCPAYTYEVEPDTDIRCAQAGDLSSESYMVTVKYETPYKLIQRVFEEAYA
jgi:hypothetical protein